MGKNSILSQEQKLILDEISQNKLLVGQFYFGGGTALSEFYLQHRYSDDLDLFTLDKFEAQTITFFLSELSNKFNFKFESQYIDPVLVSTVKFSENNILSIDWAYYPFPQLQKGKSYRNLAVDSLRDIAVNKLLSITQRTEIKDFVDLFFLLNDFTIWDLIEGVKKKFNMEIELLTLASHFTLVEDFDFLPRMIKPIALPELKRFFLLQAQSLGKTTLKP